MTSIFHNPDNIQPAQVGTGYRLCTVEEVRTKLPEDAEAWDGVEWLRSTRCGTSGCYDLVYRTRTPMPKRTKQPRKPSPLAQIRRIYASATPAQQSAVRRWANKL
jgi:hypothetical protein